MKSLEKRLEKHIDLLISRYPELECIRNDIIDAYLIFEECYENGGKMLIAGNGGSASDAQHIAGELFFEVSAYFSSELKTFHKLS